MKRTIFRVIGLVIATLTLMITAQSCSSLFYMMQDENFREGFRQGWNMTAPVDWRY